MAQSHRLLNPRRILVKELNDLLTCSLCGGYLIDATSVVDCSHTFCRACIVRHFESSRFCPNCGSLVHKSKPLSKLRSDTTLQSIIYKVVPTLYSKELQRRADFYHSTGFRANSSCSDDSILGDRSQDNDEWVLSNIGDASLYFSPDDSISLSVEYYQSEDTETLTSTIKSETENIDIPSENTDSAASSAVITDSNKTGSLPDSVTQQVNPKTDCANNGVSVDAIKSDVVATVTLCSDEFASVDSGEIGNEVVKCEPPSETDLMVAHKRFLQCPAAVRMSHLMKFLRMKYALSNEHRVDIIYDGEVLPPYLSLMDVAYTFKWNREKPMRFFYLIYIPIARPVVPQQAPVSITTTPPSTPTPVEQEASVKSEPNTADTISDTNIKKPKELKIKELVKPETADDKKDKEDNNNVKILQKSVKFVDDESLNDELKNVQKSVKFVDSNSKSNASYNMVQKVHSFDYKVKSDGSDPSENCIYDYTEPDKDEIKAFAERRDREWALQKHADQEVHVSKKRKKNKHSKNEFMHKKRKLHAEITSNEVLSKSDDSLKLKVKLSVANGHKHKHRSNSSSSSISVASIEPIKTELSPKERLLQMRQVRHKHVIAPEDKVVKNNSLPEIKLKSSPPEKSVDKSADKVENYEPMQIEEVEPKQPERSAKVPDRVPKTPERSPKLNDRPVKTSERSPKVSDRSPKVPERSPDILSSGKTLRSDFSFKTSLSKDICNKYVRVNLEKCTENKIATPKKNNINNITIRTTDKPVIVNNKTQHEGKTEITAVENKSNDNNKVVNNLKQNEIKMTNNKPTHHHMADNRNIPNNKKLENIFPFHKQEKMEEKKNLGNISGIESKLLEPKINIKSPDNKNISKNVENKITSPKPSPKLMEQKLFDESKTIENKLNNIDFKTSQSGTLVTKNFTVSKVETGTKRKLENQDSSSDKRPSLEITVINLVSRPPQTSTVQTSSIQSKPSCNTQSKSAVSISQTKSSVSISQTKSAVSITQTKSSEGPPAKKIRPPPLTIPLGRIQKMNLNKTNNIVQKPPEKCDIFGALDLSAKPNKPEAKTNDFRAHSASPNSKIQEQIQNMIRPKTPIKTTPDNIKTDPTKAMEKIRPNISNLQMLSESAVQIREMMAKGSSTMLPIPNLIKKTPTIGQNSGLKSPDFLQKNPNFQSKSPGIIAKPSNAITKNLNFTPKSPNIISKNLQKMPKLNEINKGHFCRLNANQQLRSPRPPGQNQTIRNIPNPSLLVRQQNQNRINSMTNTSSSTNNVNNKHEQSASEMTAIKTKQNLVTDNPEIEKKTNETKASEPPPLKPIETYKK